MKRLCLFLLGLFTLIGCDLASKEDKENQMQAESLKYKSFTLKDFNNASASYNVIQTSVPLDHPKSLCVVDDYIVVIDVSDKLFKIFTKDGQFITRAGIYGKGIGKMLSPWEIVHGAERKYFSIFDLTLNKIITYNIDSLVENPSYSFDREMMLGEDCGLDNIISFAQLDESNFIAISMNGRERAIHFDSSGKTKPIGAMPLNVDEVNDKVHGHAYRAKLTASKEKFAMGCFLTDIIQGFSTNGDSLFSIRGPLGFWPEYSIVRRAGFDELASNEKTRTAYTSIVSNNDRIFAVFKQNTESTTLLSFDWNGKPLDHYEINLSPGQISLSDDDELYILSKSSNGPSIIALLKLTSL